MRRGRTGIRAGQLRVDVAAHLVAVAADRRSRVNPQIRRRKAALGQRANSVFDDATGRATPAGVQQRDRARRMRDEHGNAVGDCDRERTPTLGRQMPVGFVAAQPAFPRRMVNQHPGAVHLMRRREPRTVRTKLGAQRGPATHHVAHRFVRRHAEASRRTRRRERDDAERGNVRHRLRVAGDAHFDRRSSTRSICAPSARSRSSIRS